ncbi:hypothetical protein NW762_001121 [Fusarium torreyae]|uniref:Uncharacterized protein n=1 Tax=Fusarium torreyae TaxID=1237075 RepID=A0A9W8SE48_9HYPO|nr:hypothetical protein NW762_001121 [Fusarium torreyae]
MARDFLALPYELRHKIYKAYFTLDDGYMFQPGSGKLAAADRPLDLSLMYTCRFIASETKDLPLKCNTISFSTVYHPEWRKWAGRFDYLLRAQLRMQTNVLISLGEFITPDIYSQIRTKFPWFVPELEHLVRNQRVDDFEEDYAESYIDIVTTGDLWNHSDTVYNHEDRFTGIKATGYEVSQAVNFALRLVAHTPKIDSTGSLAGSLQGWTGRHGLVDFLDQCYEPWDIPSWTELESMGKRFRDHRLWSKVQGWETERFPRRPFDAYRSKFRFSAAAVAIRFLKYLSINKRMCIRKIVIREDRIAVGHPECHAQGLIPFLRENPRLRIEVRVSLLTNILLAVNAPVDTPSFQSSVKDDEIDGSDIDTESTYDQVGRWLAEALAVVDTGIPTGSYTFFLDGEPASDLFSDIFQRYVQRDAAFIAAVETYSPSLPGRSNGSEFSHVPKRALEAIVHLVNQTSVLRCNFHPGQLWDVDTLVQDFRGRRLEEVYLEYSEQRSFTRISPLLNWRGLMMENYEHRRFPRKRKPNHR